MHLLPLSSHTVLCRTGMASLVALTLLVSSGCAFMQGSASGSAFVARDMRHLRLPAAAGDETVSVAYRSPYAYQEYDRVAGAGRAEAIVLAAHSVNAVFDLASDDLEALTRAWRFNRGGGALRWVDPRHRRLTGTAVVYRRFDHALVDTPTLACVAFIAVWDRASLDPLGRPRRGHVGYMCQPPGQTLTAQQAEQRLRAIKHRTPATPGFWIGRSVPSDTDAAPTARGELEAPTGRLWGMPGFPLNRLRQFPLGGGYSSGG